MIFGFLLATVSGLRTYFEFGRVLSGPWDWILPLVVLFLLIWNTVVMVRRDCEELGGQRAAVLIALRTLVLFGLFLVYLQPQWRSTRELTDRSQVFVLIDTSQSMGREDVAVPLTESKGSNRLISEKEGRLARIVRALEEGELLGELRAVHDVFVYRFDEDDNPLAVASLPWIDPSLASSTSETSAAVSSSDEITEEKTSLTNWSEILRATGGDTRLGDAMEKLRARSRGVPLAGIVVLSDGVQTAGSDLALATDALTEAEVPVYSIGFGEVQRPAELLLVDFAAPARAYPHDPLEVTAYIRGRGLEGRRATLRLRQIPVANEAARNEASLFEDQVEVLLGRDDGEVLPVTMEIGPLEAPGRYTFEWDLALRGEALEDDNAAEEKNSSGRRRRFQIEVESKPTRVLLVAGGPSREYQFLRNLLKRDTKHIQLDVLLQSRPEGGFEDPAYVRAFPDREELAHYDVVVAMDPEWDRLGPEAADALEHWVADEAGGLILVPGVVNAGSLIQNWSHDPEYQSLRDLFPVVFEDEFELFNDDVQEAGRVRSVQFTRDGRDAAFLQLDDSPLASQQVWQEFSGVYGPRPVKGKKYGATVYARYDDELAESLGQEPIYIAGQFYGKGRVFYQASGEMWRIRRLDAAHFEKWYTHLIRHVSAGRLHRGSPRGDVLLVEKDMYRVGDTIPIVAHLKNAARKPYQADEVTLYVFSATHPTEGQPLTLFADPVRAGTFQGEWTVREPDAYRLELAVPQSEYEPLSRKVKVLASDRERVRPEQDRSALQRLATATGGRYFTSIEAARGETGEPPLVGAVVDQTRVTPVQGDIDKVWKAQFSRWMLLGICGVLCLEWFLRRLFRLA
jgi:hypothetical protein